MREFEKGVTSVFEIANENSISGRRPISVVLHEIHRDESEYQENGVSWNEEYTRNNMHSVCGMSIVAEFIGDDRDIPYGHGMTGMKGSMPVFEDATVVGHFEEVYIDDVTIDGVDKRVCIAKGTLDEMRYPKFVEWLRERMSESCVKGSVEIVGKAENEGRIIYSNGWKKAGRVPQIYDYSGYAILSVRAADAAAIVMELNNKNEDDEGGKEMNMELLRTEMESVVSTVLSEANSRWDEYYAKVSQKEAEISQLKALIAEKEAEIAQLRADLDTANAASLMAESGLSEANAKIKALENERAIAELNSALDAFSTEERGCAADKIAAYMENPGCIEIASIVGDICTDIVRGSRMDAKTAAEGDARLDVFAIVEEPAEKNKSEVDIF